MAKVRTLDSYNLCAASEGHLDHHGDHLVVAQVVTEEES
jgi:hypothetical protein